MVTISTQVAMIRGSQARARGLSTSAFKLKRGLGAPNKESRIVREPLQACILDWSGTVSDNYVIAPAYAFVECFKSFNVPITMEEARGTSKVCKYPFFCAISDLFLFVSSVPMGLRKDLHIEALTKMPAIADRWEKIHGTRPGRKVLLREKHDD